MSHIMCLSEYHNNSYIVKEMLLLGTTKFTLQIFWFLKLLLLLQFWGLGRLLNTPPSNITQSGYIRHY